MEEPKYKFRVRFYSENTQHLHVMDIRSTGTHISRIEAAIRKEVMRSYEYYWGVRIIHVMDLN